MPPFVPPEPPIEPDAPTPPPELNVPLPPPEVGFGSPWAPADAENRDRILDWWRMWWRRVFFPWIAAWIAYWAAQWARLIAYINNWLNYAGEYIEDHAVNGHSWWKTNTVIATTGTTVVQIIPYEEFRPILIGDLVSDTSAAVSFGQVVSLVDDTHATVQYLGNLRGLTGPAGFGWWTTATTIAHSGTTAVVLEADPDREPQLNDLVIDGSESHAYGQITVVTDPTHVTVAYVGTLAGPPGIADLGSFDFTTESLAPAAAYQGLMVGQPQMVGAFSVSTDVPAWVRVYASEAYMLADAARPISTPLVISADHGCYLDFVSTAFELFKALTPGVQITDLGDGVWLSLTNTDPSDPQAIHVHFDYRTFRE